MVKTTLCMSLMCKWYFWFIFISSVVAMCISMGLHENGNISVHTKIQTTLKKVPQFPFHSKVIIKQKCWKTAKIYMLPKSSVSKLSNIPISNLNSQIEDQIFKVSRPYLHKLWRNRPSKSVTVESARLIVLNNSASHKMIMKTYFKFLKDLDLIEFSRGGLYNAYDC